MSLSSSLCKWLSNDTMYHLSIAKYHVTINKVPLLSSCSSDAWFSPTRAAKEPLKGLYVPDCPKMVVRTLFERKRPKKEKKTCWIPQRIRKGKHFHAVPVMFVFFLVALFVVSHQKNTQQEKFGKKKWSIFSIISKKRGRQVSHPPPRNMDLQGMVIPWWKHERFMLWINCRWGVGSVVATKSGWCFKYVAYGVGVVKYSQKCTRFFLVKEILVVFGAFFVWLGFI